MIIPLPRLHLCLVGLLLVSAAVVQAAPGRTAGGFSYPLDLRNEADLNSRLMSGGCWLAGLPGYPSYHTGHVHAGLDLRAGLGEQIYAIAPGVVDAQSDAPHNGYGPGWTVGRVLIVRCELPDGTPYLAVYGHTQNHAVQGGDRVAAGQALAEVGPWLEEDGGPHLHLTIRLGELPRWGWGTPTLRPNAPREGAEDVGCAAEVEGLGYRSPLEFLRGICRPAAGADATGPAGTPGTAAPAHGEAAPGTDSSPRPATPAPAEAPPASRAAPAASAPGAGRATIDTAQEFAAAARSYLRGRYGSAAPQAVADDFTRSCQPVRYGEGWCQSFASAAAKGALLTVSGRQQICWVPEPLWTIYNLKGGPGTLGAPVAEARDWPEAHAQGFDKALLVVEKQSDTVRVIWRR